MREEDLQNRSRMENLRGPIIARRGFAIAQRFNQTLMYNQRGPSIVRREVNAIFIEYYILDIYSLLNSSFCKTPRPLWMWCGGGRGVEVLCGSIILAVKYSKNSCSAAT